MKQSPGAASVLGFGLAALLAVPALAGGAPMHGYGGSMHGAPMGGPSRHPVMVMGGHGNAGRMPASGYGRAEPIAHPAVYRVAAMPRYGTPHYGTPRYGTPTSGDRGYGANRGYGRGPGFGGVRVVYGTGSYDGYPTVDNGYGYGNGAGQDPGYGYSAGGGPGYGYGQGAGYGPGYARQPIGYGTNLAYGVGAGLGTVITSPLTYGFGLRSGGFGAGSCGCY